MNTKQIDKTLRIPSIGYGTWKLETPEVCISSVLHALEAGYRHIDCARVYANEEYVGEAIIKSGIERQNLFLTSKLRNSAHGYDRVRGEVAATLKNLKTDYLDLYLIHWPVVMGHKDDWKEDLLSTWTAMEELYHEGVLKAIGVCNCSKEHLEPLLEKATVKPMVNQILIHPGVLLEDDMNFCRHHGITLEAYSPLAPLAVIYQEAEFMDICAHHKKSPGQILLRFVLELGATPLTRSTKKERLTENLNIFDFSLRPQDLTYLREWSHRDFTPQNNKEVRPPQKLDSVLAQKEG
ncbi:aldo/keto reductase [Proteiniclasticum sp.]|uniref:aldo/keto reductase family protein n=1 Tax=Proteiniclasticum sp. TaxID=2053595 RepID=UPI0025DE0CA0|nr:aldo/keto reductase [Proteiniclasticum sp.]